MISDPKQAPIKTAILLLNMGGPESAEEVHPYLKELSKIVNSLNYQYRKFLEISLHGEGRHLSSKGMKNWDNILLRVRSWKNKERELRNYLMN